MTSVRWGLLLIAVILIALSAFGVQFGTADLFRVGVAVGFASGLVP